MPRRQLSCLHDALATPAAVAKRAIVNRLSMIAIDMVNKVFSVTHSNIGYQMFFTQMRCDLNRTISLPACDATLRWQIKQA
jgi:hypothetical protein